MYRISQVSLRMDGTNLPGEQRAAWGHGGNYDWPSYDVEKLARALVALQPGRTLQEIRFYTGVSRQEVNAFWTPSGGTVNGGADVAETTYVPLRSEPGAAPGSLRRVNPAPGSQLALFATYEYHGFITDGEGEMLELEADHRRHAEIENAIRDLKYGVGLNHLPSGRFAAIDRGRKTNKKREGSPQNASWPKPF